MSEREREKEKERNALERYVNVIFHWVFSLVHTLHLSYEITLNHNLSHSINRINRRRNTGLLIRLVNNQHYW